MGKLSEVVSAVKSAGEQFKINVLCTVVDGNKVRAVQYRYSIAVKVQILGEIVGCGGACAVPLIQSSPFAVTAAWSIIGAGQNGAEQYGERKQ